MSKPIAKLQGEEAGLYAGFFTFDLMVRVHRPLN
jgi:hypothetical protein